MAETSFSLRNIIDQTRAGQETVQRELMERIEASWIATQEAIRAAAARGETAARCLRVVSVSPRDPVTSFVESRLRGLGFTVSIEDDEEEVTRIFVNWPDPKVVDEERQHPGA